MIALDDKHEPAVAPAARHLAQACPRGWHQPRLRFSRLINSAVCELPDPLLRFAQSTETAEKVGRARNYEVKNP
jgi:hypothetical protein